MPVLDAVPELDEVEDLHRLPAADVLELLAGLVVERNRLDAQIASLTRHAELTQAAEHDGLASMRSWLIGHLRLSAPMRPGSCGRGGCWGTCRTWPRRSPRAR